MSRGYALDLHTPVRHAATELERAGNTALSVSEIAATYRHPLGGDISRVRHHENCADEAQVNEWLIGQALEALRRRGSNGQVQLVTDDAGRWAFAEGVTFDDLRYDRKGIVRTVEDRRAFNDPFDKMTGRFSEDVRSAMSKAKDDVTELRESMKENGWIDDPAFHAVKDENGVVLIGHRRLRVAEELGIEPRIRTVMCGDGDAADIKRFQLAVLSNIGYREMSPGDRQKIVAVLAGPEHDWTQMSIAKALGVSQQAISKDIAGLEASGGLQRRSKPNRPKGGRPPKRPPSVIPDELVDASVERLKAGQPLKPLREQFGVTKSAVEKAGFAAHHIIKEREPVPVVDAAHSHEYMERWICDCGAEKP